MPVRLLTQSVLRWPDPSEVLAAVGEWAQSLAEHKPGLLKVGVYGSYGRGEASVGSDLDVLLIDALAQGTQSQRFRTWPWEQLPLSCDALVLTPDEFQAFTDPSPQDPAAWAMAQALHHDCRWLWQR